MRRFMTEVLSVLTIALGLVALTNTQASAQDSVFKDLKTYEEFVDGKIMKRDFVPLIQQLGGRDEYTPEQLKAANAQLLNAFPQDFTNKEVFKIVELNGGVRQEARMYWNGVSYAFYYALLHQRVDGLVVIRFALNSSSDKVMGLF